MKLDDMLSKWPMAERSQLEADEAAERVVAAIEGGQIPASTDEALLAPPLPKTPDEGQTSAPPTPKKPGSAASPVIAGVESKMSKDRTRDRTSFQELAKMATTPPPPTASAAPPPPSANASGSGPAAVVRGKEADSSDSGIVDLKMIASADPSGEQRAQTTPLAAAGLYEDESAPAKPTVSAAAAETATATAASSPPAKAVAQAAPTQSAKQAVAAEKKSGGGIVIALGGLVVLAAAAAGAFFYVKHSHRGAAVATTTSQPDKAAQASPTAAGAGATATAAAASSVADLEADDLPATDPNGKPALHGGHVHHHRNAAGPAPTDEAPKPEGTVDPKLVANIPTGPAGGNNGDLNSAMKAAAGGGTGLGASGGQSDSQGPKYAPGSVPERPSQGQVLGAIGLVMGGARACVPADSPVSRATITFQSDGTVKSVSVTGFAAGKPAEACIKGALSKAKVDPFAEATYPMTVSIRSSQ